LTASFPKTKFRAIGTSVSTESQQPFSVSGGSIEWIPYLGSKIVNEELFLQKLIEGTKYLQDIWSIVPICFYDCHLSIKTKRLEYQACVLSMSFVWQ